MNYQRRIQRLEEVLGTPGCSCCGPGLVVVRAYAGETVPPAGRCKAHGEIKRTVVRIVDPTGRASATEPVRRVNPNLPPPERRPHQEHSTHGVDD